MQGVRREGEGESSPSCLTKSTMKQVSMPTRRPATATAICKRRSGANGGAEPIKAENRGSGRKRAGAQGARREGQDCLTIIHATHARRPARRSSCMYTPLCARFSSMYTLYLAP
jgi:hypothetical protein